MPACDIIVVGGSAGAVEGMKALARSLPADLTAAVFIVLHVPADFPSLLPQILSRAGALPASHPQDCAPVRRGHIYVAPPDRHLTLDHGVIRVTKGPRENRHRPAIDPLFRSAARVYGGRVIGVILSGQLDDGAAGLRAIKSRGGVGIVQDPGEASSAPMPQAAIEHGGADFVLPVHEIGPKTVSLTGNCEGVAVRKSDNGRVDESPERNLRASTPDDGEGVPSAFACPECSGVLWELHDGHLIRFRCRVGHSYTLSALAQEQQHGTESALWAAMRALEEKASLQARASQSAIDARLAARLKEQADTDRNYAETIRKMLFVDDKEVTPAG